MELLPLFILHSPPSFLPPPQLLHCAEQDRLRVLQTLGQDAELDVNFDLFRAEAAASLGWGGRRGKLPGVGGIDTALCKSITQRPPQ